MRWNRFRPLGRRHQRRWIVLDEIFPSEKSDKGSNRGELTCSGYCRDALFVKLAEKCSNGEGVGVRRAQRIERCLPEPGGELKKRRDVVLVGRERVW